MDAGPLLLFAPPREVLDFDGIEVQILDRETFESLPAVPCENRLLAVVSITDPGDKPVREGHLSSDLGRVVRHDVAFYDIPHPMLGLTGVDQVAEGTGFCLSWMATKAKVHADAGVKTRLIVHCTAGIARSAAVAVVWLKQFGRDPSRLYELFCPNPWVVQELERGIAKRKATP